MKRVLVSGATALVIAVAPGQAQEFGLKDAALAGQFYDEAVEIAKRGLTPEQRLFYDVQNSGNGGAEADFGFGVLRDAYRADPEAALELIRRIMEAGESK